MRWSFLAAFLAAESSVCAAFAHAQSALPPAANPAQIEPARASAPFIAAIAIQGLRRVPKNTIRAHVGSRAGTRLNERQVADDVRALAKLGWFRDIGVSEAPVETGPEGFRSATSNRAGQNETSERNQPMSFRGLRHVELIYRVEENPFLTEVGFAGSQVLSREEIEALLTDKNAVPSTGEPADDAAIYRAALAIREALGELGFPRSHVRIERRERPNATLQVRYVIDDGPKVTVGRVRFEGNPALPENELRARMREIDPGKWFAGLRGKSMFSELAFEDDRTRLLECYADHGYPDAKIGHARVSVYEEETRRWFPWPRRAKRMRQSVAIPVEAGRFYRIEKIEVDENLKNSVAKKRAISGMSGQSLAAKAYSEQGVEQLRREWFARVNAGPGKIAAAQFRGVDAERTFDPQSGTVTVRLGLSSKPPVIVKRIDIRGLHKFKDNYVRRRLVLEEGRPLDERALEAGLSRLTRTGYFRPVRKEDVRVEVDERERTAQVLVRLNEIGQQRVSLTGGQSSFGSTLGIVYSVFDLLNREDLLSGQIEGGPQSAVAALGLVKDGFLASRGGLALSVFDNVVRPRMSGSIKGPFYIAQSEGIDVDWNYTISSSDAVGVNYAITRNVTHYSVPVPDALAGIVSSAIRARTDSRSLGASWTHDSGNARKVIDGSVSGGWLGGDEQVLRSSAEYGRIARDPVFSRQNAWAFRVYTGGAGSYSGDMPLYARIYSGDELVRGLRPGELGPYAASSTLNAGGATKYSAVPAGSNLVAAANMEYRVPVREGLQAAGFLDLGTGLLLPNWLGPSRPTLLAGTNGILHGATGIQLTWTLPGVRVPLRTYCALNVRWLDRVNSLPDGTFFRAHNRLAAFGWALGSLF